MSITKTYLFQKYNAGTFSVFQDNKRIYWVGNGYSYLCKFDEELTPIDSIQFSSEYYNLEGITGNTDTLWVASMGQGLIRYITKSSL